MSNNRGKKVPNYCVAICELPHPRLANINGSYLLVSGPREAFGKVAYSVGIFKVRVNSTHLSSA
jgi:hypothetical protein